MTTSEKKIIKDSFLPKGIQDRIAIFLALISCVIAAYFLIYGIPRTWTGKMTPIGSITMSSEVRRRHAGTLSWQDIKGTEVVYLRDIVYVPKGVTAEVVLKGKDKKMTIPSDTMVQFDETSLNSIEITLIELKVTPLKLPTHKTNLSNFLEDLTPYELRISELKSRAFKAIYEAPELAKAFPMYPNKFALDKISDFALKLISPEPDRYNLRANRWMKMAWTPIPLPDVSYTLEVSKDAKLRKTLPHQTKSNILMIQFDDEATFYWRVKASLEGEQIASNSSSLSFVLRGGKTPTLSLVRTLGSELPKYSLEIAKDSDFYRLIKTVTHETPICPREGLAKGKYYCRVRTTSDTKIQKSFSFVVK